MRPRDKARRRQRRWRRRRRQRGRKENSFWRHAVILPPEAAERKASERNSISRSQFGARCHLDPKRHLLTAPPREERKIRPLPSLLNRPLGHLTSPATTERQLPLCCQRRDSHRPVERSRQARRQVSRAGGGGGGGEITFYIFKSLNNWFQLEYS